jgi:glycosidase
MRRTAQCLHVIFDIVLNHAGDVFGCKRIGSTAPGGSQLRPIEWRDARSQARPDFPVIESIPCLYYGTEQGLHGHGDSDPFVRQALWGKSNAFDVDHLSS